MGYGGTKEYVQALRDIVVAIMIEKPGTVDTLEEVLSVKGVDMVQWGGSDYSMGIGRAGERYSPQLRVVECRVFETVSFAKTASDALGDELRACDRPTCQETARREVRGRGSASSSHRARHGSCSRCEA
jgi:2-keto-3-deoxy-L-rhamnonate aldolase RhmA